MSDAFTFSSTERDLAALPADRAAMVVADSFSHAPPLSLGAELALRGGDADTLKQLRMDLAFGLRPELDAAFDEALRMASSESSPWLVVPPLLLCGPGGAGRTHVARRFAHRAGLPHVVMDVAEAAGEALVGHSPHGPDLVLPAAPVLAMAVGRCANPVISVVGVEELSDAGQRRLATMIDPSTAAQWIDHAAQATVDLRQVSWFIQSRNPHAIVPQLLRLLNPVELRWPDDQQLFVVEVLAEAAVDLGVVDRVGPVISEAINALLPATRRMSTAEVYAQARRWVADNFFDSADAASCGATLSDRATQW